MTRQGEFVRHQRSRFVPRSRAPDSTLRNFNGGFSQDQLTIDRWNSFEGEAVHAGHRSETLAAL